MDRPDSAGLGQFRRLVADTADVLVHQILPDAAPLLIMGCDAPFLGLAPRLPASAVQKLVLVPRSTAGIHAPGDHERRAWELFGMHATSSGGGRIAAICRYMAQHLHHDYAIPADTLVDLPVALTAADWDIPAPDPRLLPDPAREGFVLAMGRAHPYKGFDDLFDAAILLRRTGFPLPHLVVAAVTDDPHANEYQRHLAERITTADLDATLITRFDTGIRNLLGHHALRAIVVPSRAEPCGRIPIEAYAAGACPVIGTTAGGLAEQILHGYTGFSPHHPPILQGWPQGSAPP
ncbi:glycosyltransferase family 4 protein [Nocardia terpenica]|uniref:glycosyltransferase family 4 protein n=1 Tax=Nocardia terpenica TaxID=455432 RepID=UPI002FE0AA0B